MKDDKEALKKAIVDYDKAKGMDNALGDVCDFMQKYVDRIERQLNAALKLYPESN